VAHVQLEGELGAGEEHLHRRDAVVLRLELDLVVVEAHPDLIGIPVMPSIEQRIGVIWKKGKHQNTTAEKVIKYIENF